MEIRALREEDDRSRFHSGDADLDRFFGRYAGQNQFRHHIGVSYVAVEVDRIHGFVTVAAGTLEGDDLPARFRRKLPGYPLPVLRVARLAVGVEARDRGIGRLLLRHAFRLALEMAERFGCVGIVVDAKPDAVEYYGRFGFEAIDVIEGSSESRPQPRAMFLPLALVADA